MPDLFAPLATEYPPSDQKEKYESNGKQNNSDYFNNRRNKRRKESESYPRLRSLEEIKSSGKGRRNIDNVMNDSISRHDSRENRHFREPDLGHTIQQEHGGDLPSSTLPTGPLIPPPSMILPSSSFTVSINSFSCFLSTHYSVYFHYNYF